jgi:hypothetical protein
VYNVATDISYTLSQGDYDTALNLVRSFLAGIPVMQGEESSLQDIRARETYYHKQLFIIFRMLHDDAWAEVQQAVGRPDIVVKTRKFIYFARELVARGKIRNLSQFPFEALYVTFFCVEKHKKLVETNK